MQHWAEFLFLLGLGVLIYLVRGIPVYINKKAENLAQKEDLRKLTEIAESIRAQFNRLNVVHRVQFEAEFKAYQALWSAAHDAVVAFIRWQSLTFETTTAEVIAFGEAQLAFANALKRNEPFIPEIVLREFKGLDELFVDVKIDYQSGLPTLPPAKSKGRTAIEEAEHRCVTAIKQRLSEILII